MPKKVLPAVLQDLLSRTGIEPFTIKMFPEVDDVPPGGIHVRI